MLSPLDANGGLCGPPFVRGGGEWTQKEKETSEMTPLKEGFFQA